LQQACNADRVGDFAIEHTLYGFLQWQTDDLQVFGFAELCFALA
jgi:hypothetical protein